MPPRAGALPSGAPTIASPTLRHLIASASCASFIALALQLWSVRLLSNLVWDQFAATVVAGGMAGFAAGAWWASRRLRHGVPQTVSGLERGFLLLGLGQLAFWLLLTRVEFEPFRAVLLPDPRRLFELGILWGAILLMTGCAGWLLAQVVSLSGTGLRAVYSADLLGGCAGVCAAVLLGGWIGPLHGVLLCAAAAMLWSLQLRRLRAPPLRAPLHWGLCTAAISVPILLWGRGELQFPEGKYLHDVEQFVERTIWDPAVRLDVMQPVRGHFFGAGGIAHPQPEDEFEHRIVLQDGGAPTAILGLAPGDVETRAVWRKYLQAAPFAVLERPRVLILGPGGGLEIAISLHHAAESVECVEINSSLIRLCREDYRDFQSGLLDRPEVSVRWGEGRHFLGRTQQKYDLILMCGLDSFAAGAGGASAAVENSLYTVEAAQAMLARLTERGVLAVTRRLFRPEREALRFTVTLATALERGAKHPADALCVVEGPPTGTGVAWAMMMARPSGFTREDQRRIEAWSGEQGHRLLYGGAASSDPLFDRVIRADRAQRAALLAGYPFDLTPVTDDRPYFFLTAHRSQLWSDAALLLRGRVPVERIHADGVPLPVAIVTGMLVAAMVALLAFAVLFHSVLRAWRRNGAVPLLAWPYFALTGAGTLLAEIGLFQIGSFLLGMPFLAVSIVLAGVLLGAGIGARWRGNGLPLLIGAAVLLVLTTAAWACKLAWQSPPPGLLAGCSILAAISISLGVCSGSFFPAGISSFAGLDEPPERARAFTVSTAFSVAGAAAGPVLAVLCGTRALLAVSALALTGAAAVLASRGRITVRRAAVGTRSA